MRDREIGRSDLAGQVGVAGGIHRDPGDAASSGTSEVSGVREDGINDKAARTVVTCDFKADFAGGRNKETPGDALAKTAALLVDLRKAMADESGFRRGADDEVPAIHAGTGAIEGEADAGQIGMRSDFEIVFERAVAAVQDEVDARPHSGVADACVVRDTAMPLAGIIPDEVVADAGKKVLTGDGRVAISAGEPHAEGRGGAAQSQAITGQINEATAGGGEEKDLRRELAMVGFKLEGQRRAGSDGTAHRNGDYEKQNAHDYLRESKLENGAGQVQ